jgi:hypothetical protein
MTFSITELKSNPVSIMEIFGLKIVSSRTMVLVCWIVSEKKVKALEANKVLLATKLLRLLKKPMKN